MLGALSNQLASYTDAQIQKFISNQLKDEEVDRKAVTAVVRDILKNIMVSPSDTDTGQEILDKQSAPQNAIRFMGYEQFYKLFVSDTLEV